MLKHLQTHICTHNEGSSTQTHYAMHKLCKLHNKEPKIKFKMSESCYTDYSDFGPKLTTELYSM